MKTASFFSRLRAIAAKSPITFVHQAPTSFSGALFVLVLAVLVAATIPPIASAQIITYAGSGAVNFGSANVCPSGKTTPAPCSQTLTLTYSVTESGTLGTPQALTTGAANLDYKLAGGNTCSGSVIKGNTCKVNVTFAPISPGPRNGAVEIVDTRGNVLATTYIYGMGVGPLLGLGPPALRTIATFPGSYGASGKLVPDGNGNLLFVDRVDNNHAFLAEMVAVNGSVPVNPVIKHFPIVDLFSSYFFSSVLAIDGAGNLFTTQLLPSSPNPTIVEIPAAGGYTTLKTIASGFTDPTAIVVDRSGNLFAIDSENDTGNAEVKEVPAVGNYAKVERLGGGFAFYFPTDLALDSNGNLFVTDRYLKDGPNQGAVVEIPAANGYDTAKIIHVNSAQFGGPASIAIDAANNLLVSAFDAYGKFLAVDGVVPPNPTALYFYIDSSGSAYPSISLDGHGNIYSANYYYYYDGTLEGIVEELPLSTPPALAFAPTSVGHTSTDSPQVVQIQNQGNAALDLTGLALDSSNWELVPGSGSPEDCTTTTSLTSSGLCNLSISFKPTEATKLSGAVTLTDNSLNVPGSAQSITLNGTGVIPYITSLNYTYGAPYSVIYVYGYNFNASKGSNIVTFNGVAAPVYYATSTFILTTVPGNATTGNLVVTVNGQPSNPVPFTVVPQPTIVSISPTSGPVGTYVTFTGTNLWDLGNKGTVSFNGELLSATFLDSTELYVQVPPGAVTDEFHLVINDTGINTPTFTVTK